jgi:thymidylate synthase (FAD)
MRHRHTTPFEMLEFKFHVSMPIFVARQWIRHRTANVNEYSARYSILPDRFYVPTAENVRKQSGSNRQGGADRFEPGDDASPGGASTAAAFLQYLSQAESLYGRYMGLTEQGVSRELARIGLPVNMYTQWYWKCDLHNILRFLSLRMDPHAQEEIREYAEAMFALLQPIVPIAMEAFRDYELDSIRLTSLEIETMRAIAGGDSAAVPRTENKRERAEWEEKRKRLSL